MHFDATQDIYVPKVFMILVKSIGQTNFLLNLSCIRTSISFSGHKVSKLSKCSIYEHGDHV